MVNELMSKSFPPQKSGSEIQSKPQSSIHFSVPESKPTLHEVLKPKIKVKSVQPEETKKLDVDKESSVLDFSIPGLSDESEQNQDDANDLDLFVFPFSSEKDERKEEEQQAKMSPQDASVGNVVKLCFDYEIQQQTLELDFSEQCESNFYPERPLSEAGHPLMSSGIDDLAQVNQYCWHGTRDFVAPIDLLVFGDGPRDSVMILAEQLAGNPDARITYVEPNEKILEHTKYRLQVRADQKEIPHIVKMVDFQSKLPTVDSKQFDYISFHALFFENETFDRIRSLLKEDGVLGFGVRGQVAHAPQESIRNLMRIVNREVEDIEEQIQNTQLILEHLPKSHPLVQNGLTGDYVHNRLRLYLDFLKPGYRSFAMSHLVQWLNDHRLRLARFQPHMQVCLNPGMYPNVLPRSIQKHLESLPRLNQIAFAELFWGNLDRFDVYTIVESSQNGPLDLMNPEIIPSFSESAKKQGYDAMAGNPALWLAKTPSYQFGICGKTASVGIKYDHLVADFLSRIDGQTTVRAISAALAEKHDADQEKIALHCMQTILNFIEVGVITFHKKQDA